MSIETPAVIAISSALLTFAMAHPYLVTVNFALWRVSNVANSFLRTSDRKR
jgi:hypothetical protein